MKLCGVISIDEGLIKNVRTKMELLFQLPSANLVSNRCDERLWEEISRMMGTHMTARDPIVQAAQTWIEPYFMAPRNLSEFPQFLL